MLTLNIQKSGVPIYRQLYDQTVRQILDGTCAPDECLPSIRAVARTLGVGVITVKTTYEMLERDGYIYTLPSKGCFVSSTAPRDKLALARERLQVDLRYYRELQVEKADLLRLIDELYGKP